MHLLSAPRGRLCGFSLPAVGCLIVPAVLLLACSAGENEAGSGPKGSSAATSSAGATGSGAASSAGSTGGGGESAASGPRFNEVQQKAVHNSYDRDEALLDQLIYHRVRALELDIHIGKWTWPEVPGDWYVYHTNGPGLNNTSCHRFSDCLRELSAFQSATPEHEVTTIFVDLKDAFQASGHAPEDLDTRILGGLDKSALFTPADLLARCPGATSLRAAVAGACAWPTLAELRGKIVFALTGGDLCGPSSVLGAYLGQGAATTSRVAFVAPDLSDTCPLSKHDTLAPDAVFFNMDYSNVDKAKGVDDAGLVSRVYHGGATGGLDQEDHWTTAKADKAHFLATDKVNFEETPWAVTHNTLGYPFSCFAGCDPALEEKARILSLRVRSGDLWGSSDHFDFLYKDDESGAGTWTAQISTANSHVEPFAKGCLMARAALSADSAYFAVCRPADAHVIRVQSRPKTGADTSETEVPLLPSDTIVNESVTFVKLELLGPAATPTAKGYASQDGVTWVLIASASLPMPLPYRGVTASGHGSATPVKFLFGDLTKNADSATPMTLSSLPKHTQFGDCSLAEAFDGVLRP
jgi:hypothetical protein